MSDLSNPMPINWRAAKRSTLETMRKFLIEQIHGYKLLKAIDSDPAMMPVYPAKLAEPRAQLIEVAGFLEPGGGR